MKLGIQRRIHGGNDVLNRPPSNKEGLIWGRGGGKSLLAEEGAMEPILSWSRNKQTSITGTECNRKQIIGDKYKEVDRADAEEPGKLWEGFWI